MITVMKASAGSGKTFALAQKYIRMLLLSTNPHEYRHILAVTFTNKATDEMKSRIIEELFKVAHPEIAGKTQMDVPDEPEKAARILSDILHDYSAFAVSTIDKFFQQTLRAFARELGHFNKYQIELNKDDLVMEAVDSILDDLDADNPKDRKMIDFIVENMEETVAEGNSINVDTPLKNMACNLKSEAFNRIKRALGTDVSKVYGDDELRELKKTCRRMLSEYETLVKQAATGVMDACDSIGLSFSDFKGTWIQSVNKFIDWKVSKSPLPSFSSAQERNILEPTEATWFKKADAYKYPAACSTVLPALQHLYDVVNGQPNAQYNTANIILSQLYGLSVAARLFDAFERISKEKNVMCLDESNNLLHDIIDGSDAPFVYEKTGVRFDTFMLDEFQDTSLTQWDNFLPLLIESESYKGVNHTKTGHDFDNLIVGDVKQSIYRWREGEWTLLDHGVENDIAGHIYKSPLYKNWRSLTNIIDFNNLLYPALANKMDAVNSVPDGETSVENIYHDCNQTPGKETQQGGSVAVEFVEDDDTQLQTIIDTITDLRDNHGARYGDIAILVRKNDTGTIVAQSLISVGIPVVTDASLSLKNSISVRRLVSMMSYVNDPSDNVGTYMAAEYGLNDIPTAYHSLPDLVETLYNALCSKEEYREDCSKEVMYMVSFMDYVMNYSNKNGSNLKEFLRIWDTKDPQVNAASGSDAVRIMTIHKSKGLAFPYVIIPYLERIPVYNNNKTSRWAGIEASEGPLAPFSDRPFHVKLTSVAANSAFSDTYLREKYNQGVDVLNLLYVATTRAEKGMTILSNVKGRNFNSSIAALLFSWCDSKDYYLGEVFDFGAWHAEKDASDARKQVGDNEYELSCPCHSIDQRLCIRPYAADFFTESDNTYEGLDYRERGIVLHDILSRVIKASDLEASVDRAISEGSLAAESKQKVMSFLGRRIATHPAFFAKGESSDPKVITETGIIASDGTEHRPDRVLIYPDGRVLIVDYKFGAPKDAYAAQMECYRNLFLDMGYKDVEAVLWYVYQQA